MGVDQETPTKPLPNPSRYPSPGVIPDAATVDDLFKIRNSKKSTMQDPPK